MNICFVIWHIFIFKCPKVFWLMKRQAHGHGQWSVNGWSNPTCTGNHSLSAIPLVSRCTHIKEFDYCLIVLSQFWRVLSITSRELGWCRKSFCGKMRNKWCLAGGSLLCCREAAPAPIFNWFSALQNNPQARKPVLGPHMWALSVCVMCWG